jgi:hypothetical protein
MPHFQAGGGVDASKYVSDIGDQVGEAIAKKLEDVTLKLGTDAFEDLVTRLENTKIDFNIPNTADLPKLEIGNLDEVLTALDRGVGATRGQGKIDTFIDKIETELRQFDTQISDNTNKIQMIERSQEADTAAEKSRIEAKLQGIVSEITTTELVPLKSEISMIHYTLDSTIREVNENYDKLVSLGNRIGMK